MSLLLCTPLTAFGASSSELSNETEEIHYFDIPASQNPFLSQLDKEYIQNQGYNLDEFITQVDSRLFISTYSTDSISTTVLNVLLGNPFEFKTQVINKGTTVSNYDYGRIMYYSYTWNKQFDVKQSDDWTFNFDCISAQGFRGYDMFIHGENVELSEQGTLSGQVIFSSYANPSLGNRQTFNFNPPASMKTKLWVSFFNPNFGNSSGKYNLGYLSIDITVENQKAGILSGVQGFFKNLGDRISQWFENLRNWFTELGNKISSSFDNLINNMKSWFDNVGQWFKDLGNDIKTWFTDLINNIKQSFENVQIWFDEHLIQPVRDWWQGIVDWFKVQFTLPDGFFDEWQAKWQTFLEARFGFLYESVELIKTTFQNIIDAFSSESRNVIDIPEIKLPDSFGGYVLMEKQSFDFNELLDKSGPLKMAYGLYVTVMYGAALFALVALGARTLEEILKDREVSD